MKRKKIKYLSILGAVAVAVPVAIKCATNPTVRKKAKDLIDSMKKKQNTKKENENNESYHETTTFFDKDTGKVIVSEKSNNPLHNGNSLSNTDANTIKFSQSSQGSQSNFQGGNVQDNAMNNSSKIQGTNSLGNTQNNNQSSFISSSESSNTNVQGANNTANKNNSIQSQIGNVLMNKAKKYMMEAAQSLESKMTNEENATSYQSQNGTSKENTIMTSQDTQGENAQLQNGISQGNTMMTSQSTQNEDVQSYNGVALSNLGSSQGESQLYGQNNQGRKVPPLSESNPDTFIIGASTQKANNESLTSSTSDSLTSSSVGNSVENEITSNNQEKMKTTDEKTSTVKDNNIESASTNSSLNSNIDKKKTPINKNEKSNSIKDPYIEKNKEYNEHYHIEQKIFGKWIISKVKAIGKSNIYNKEKIDEIIGEKISYSNVLVNLNGKKHKEPKYSSEFIDSNVAFPNGVKEKLNIKDEKIEFIFINKSEQDSDPDSIKEIGRCIAVLDNKPLLYSGGVLFEIERVI